METAAAESRSAKQAHRTMDYQQLLRRFRSAQADKSAFEQSCDQIEKFIAPFSGGRIPGNDSESSIEWKRLQVWDFTAIDGSQKLAANIHGSVSRASVIASEIDSAREPCGTKEAAQRIAVTTLLTALLCDQCRSIFALRLALLPGEHLLRPKEFDRLVADGVGQRDGPENLPTLLLAA